MALGLGLGAARVRGLGSFGRAKALRHGSFEDSP